jgi:hypothetical protein
MKKKKRNNKSTIELKEDGLDSFFDTKTFFKQDHCFENPVKMLKK